MEVNISIRLRFFAASVYHSFVFRVEVNTQAKGHLFRCKRPGNSGWWPYDFWSTVLGFPLHGHQSMREMGGGTGPVGTMSGV
ncbi:conserved domain protein [Actinomyces sp. oral taxon 170 str. F0386]|nr:conserved domain protein [Actinomyces sp. oral taxon 170 str. F0386]